MNFAPAHLKARYVTASSGFKDFVRMLIQNGVKRSKLAFFSLINISLFLLGSTGKRDASFVTEVRDANKNFLFQREVRKDWMTPRCRPKKPFSILAFPVSLREIETTQRFKRIEWKKEKSRSDRISFLAWFARNAKKRICWTLNIVEIGILWIFLHP